MTDCASLYLHKAETPISNINRLSKRLMLLSLTLSLSFCLCLSVHTLTTVNPFKQQMAEQCSIRTHMMYFESIPLMICVALMHSSLPLCAFWLPADQ